MPQSEFEAVGLHVPTVLLPAKGVDLTNWAVVACDQYTSQPSYWEAVESLVENAPSTFHLILPEVYLGAEDEEDRITSIQDSMTRYLEDGTLHACEPGFILVDRKTAHHPSRKGLVVGLDLEQYDYNKGADTLIRATEGTILDRLPPRVRVREDAHLELPHIMVLIDDPDQTVIEPLFENELPILYDFSLMQEGGHLRGSLISDEGLQRQVAGALQKLASPASFGSRYGVQDQPPLLYAMGDGNHSFATAKAIWESLKAEAGSLKAVEDHPARYALVELVNLHDPGLTFEPIHRVLFGVSPEACAKFLLTYFAGLGIEAAWKETGDALEWVPADSPAVQRIPFVSEAGRGLLELRSPLRNLAVASLQEGLDAFLGAHPNGSIDYIHGADVVSSLAVEPGNIGFLLPDPDKHQLFRTIILDGALPRKTFSMGEPDEKRFYLEARRIRKG